MRFFSSSWDEIRTKITRNPTNNAQMIVNTIDGNDNDFIVASSAIDEDTVCSSSSIISSSSSSSSSSTDQMPSSTISTGASHVNNCDDNNNNNNDDGMIFGLEQIIVCVVLVLVSLWILSSKRAKHDFVAMFKVRFYTLMNTISKRITVPITGIMERQVWVGRKSRWVREREERDETVIEWEQGEKKKEEEEGEENGVRGKKQTTKFGMNMSSHDKLVAPPGRKGWGGPLLWTSPEEQEEEGEDHYVGESSSADIIHDWRQQQQHHHQQQQQHKIRRSPPPYASPLPPPFHHEEEETEHDKFVRAWPHIRMSNYRKLVLPPVCKLVDPPKGGGAIKKLHLSHKGGTIDEEKEWKKCNEEEKKKKKDETTKSIASAWKQWMSNCQWLFCFVSTFDYVDFLWTLITWVMKMIHIRKINKSDEEDEEDEREEPEEEDGGDVPGIDTHKSSSTPLSLTAHPSFQSGTTKGEVSQLRHMNGPASLVDGIDEASSIADDDTQQYYRLHHQQVQKEQQQQQQNVHYNSAVEFDLHIINDEEKKDAAEEKKKLLSTSSAAIPGGDESVTSYTSASSSSMVTGPSHVTSSTRSGGRMRGDSLGSVDDSGYGGGSSNNSSVAVGPQHSVSSPISTGAAGMNEVVDRKITKSPTPLVHLGGSSTIRGSSLGSKRKDALESYRSRANIPPPSMPPLPTAGASEKAPLAFQPHFTSISQGRHLPSSSASASSSSHHSEFLSKSLPPIASVPNTPERNRSGTSDGPPMNFFDAANSRDSLKKLSREVPVPDKNGYILGDEFLPDSRYTPLLVFVNSRSGPQQGQVLITQLRRLLNPIQVWDLADGGPEKVLESFSALSRLRILVCGGDGTVSWIISALEKMQLERWPPIAILPLGTGNDLARIHGWGGGYNNESLLLILQQVSDAYVSLLDRWEMTIEEKKGKVKETKAFINYLGVGVDAQAALQVHMLRESKPKLFFSRAVNKAWYAIAGAEDAIKASCANLPQHFTLVADGVEVPLPQDSQGIIFLNVDSYSGGVPLWSQGMRPRKFGDRRFSDGDFSYPEEHDDSSSHAASVSVQPIHRIDSVESLDEIYSKELSEEDKLARLTACDMPSSCQDGMLDVVSLRGTFHLGQIRVGLSNAQLLCQCREATITLKKKVPVQIDGEPWRQNACTLKVKRKKDPAVMLHRSPEEGGGLECEMAKLLDWAEERHIIDRNVHATLMKEFSRRIENKTRQRRVRSQDNLVLSMRRAINSSQQLSSY